MDPFQAYFSIFLSAGKPLNDLDMRKACMEWLSMPDAEHERATEDARRVCMLASAACFVPYPVNHLRSKGWTRIAMPRTLPSITPKQLAGMEQVDEVAQKLAERNGR